MKKLILAASLTLFAAPAFAADTSAAPQQQTAMATNAQQKHSYNYSSDEGVRGAIATRNARMHRVEMERSDNAKAAWSGSAHYY
jgi:hypothetical protein